MNRLWIVGIAFFIAACSTNDIDYVLARMAGNKPPQFFKFTSPEKVERWYFETKDYEALPPKTYKKDWIKMRGWSGASDSCAIALSLEGPYTKKYGTVLRYNYEFSSWTDKYGKMERAIENGDIEYIRSNIRIDPNDKLYIQRLGKENYLCTVMEYTKKHYEGNKYIGYSCYKFNSDKTKYKEVTIIFTYTKSPHLPAKYKSLAKEYTFEDMLQRGKRVLDSLYIKDGWD